MVQLVKNSSFQRLEYIGLIATELCWVHTQQVAVLYTSHIKLNVYVLLVLFHLLLPQLLANSLPSILGIIHLPFWILEWATIGKGVKIFERTIEV